MEDMERTLGEIIREERKNRRWRIVDFAKKLSESRIYVSTAYISRIESQNEIPNPELICRIAKFFDLNPLLLLQIAKKGKICNYEKLLTKKYDLALELYKEK